MLKVQAARFDRLNRLGLLRKAPGGFNLDEIREDLAIVEEVERRIAAIGEGLSQTERGGAFAWLAEAARGTLRGADPSVGRARRVRELLDILEAQGRMAGGPAVPGA